MRYRGFVEAGLWALGFAALVELLSPNYRLLGVGAFGLLLWPRVSDLFRIRRTGLKAIYVRARDEARAQLRVTLDECQKDDEVLLVGRTHKGLLGDNEGSILEALRRGVTLRLLFLDLRSLVDSKPGQTIDLRSLRLPNAHEQLVEDLGKAETILRTLRDACRVHNVQGSLLIYRTDVLVQSSVVIHRPHDRRRPMRLLYDFSFGDKPSDKFVQFYKARQDGSPDDFCQRLYRFYGSMFEVDVSFLAYDLSYRHSQDAKRLVELERLAEARFQNVLEAHPQHETIRDNSLTQLIPAAAEVFRTIATGSRVPPPVSVQIELTNKCSTACAHCLRYGTSGPPHMRRELAERLLAELGSLGVGTVTFSGGEPTQHPDFNYLVRYAADRKMAVGVLSNGVGLTGDTLRTIHDHARWLRLSVDGSSAAVYGRVRKSLVGEGAFDEVTETIRRFVHLDQIRRRCKLAICYTIQRENVEDVPAMIEFVSGLGLLGGDRALVFKLAHGRGDFLCTPGQLRWLHDNCLKAESALARTANVPYLRWFLEQQSSMRDHITGRPAEAFYVQQRTRCFTPYMFSLIDPKGDVYPCCFLFEDNSGYDEPVAGRRREHCLGSVEGDRTFSGLWEGPEYQQLREDLSIIDPLSKRYRACGECTRHCSHNRWLSQLYEEYRSLEVAGGDGEGVMSRVGANVERRPVWL